MIDEQQIIKINESAPEIPFKLIRTPFAGGAGYERNVFFGVDSR
jgi:hypothetical protein